MKNFFKFSLIAIIAISLTSCSYKPIFARNDHYVRVGEEGAQKDFELCKKEADDYLDQFKAERAMKEAGRKSVIGAVVGTTVGLLGGGGARSILTSTGVGAGIGGAYGGLSVAGEDKVSPDQMKQRYIADCLGKEGYSILGWR